MAPASPDAVFVVQLGVEPGLELGEVVVALHLGVLACTLLTHSYCIVNVILDQMRQPSKTHKIIIYHN